MDHMVKLYLALWENSKLFSKWLFFHSNPFCGPCMAWLIASLSYASVFTTAKLWSMKGIKKKKSQAGWITSGIRIAGRNINNLRYANDTTLMAESEGDLKSLLMMVKEESEIAALKLNIQNTKIMAYYAITSWQIEGEKVEAITDFIFLDSKITAYDDCIH